MPVSKLMKLKPNSVNVEPHSKSVKCITFLKETMNNCDLSVILLNKSDETNANDNIAACEISNNIVLNYKTIMKYVSTYFNHFLFLNKFSFTVLWDIRKNNCLYDLVT